MRKIDDSEIQSYLIKIMEAFDQFAKDNHLTYYLSGGTLIGAVRHQGFIPWDDDIDIMMPRKDYEFVLSRFQHPRYRVIDCESNPNFGTSYARIWDTHTKIQYKNSNNSEFGIYMDVLPMDGYPDSLLLSKLLELRLYILRKKRLFATYILIPEKAKFKGLKKLYKKLNKKTANEYSREINRLGRKRAYESSKFVGVLSATHNVFKERNPKTLFDKTLYMNFENLNLPVPAGYDTYLRHIFGDYMQLPPPEQRVRRHGQPFYDIEE